MQKKTKKIFSLIFKTAITIVSFYIIFLKIKEYKTTDFIISQFDEISICLILTTFLLMPLNWFIETVKWRFLIDKIKNVELSVAYKAVLSGIPFALISPNRTGEIIGRVFILDKQYRGKAAAATFVGSLSQMFITLLAGFIAGIFFLFAYSDKETGISSENIFYLKIISVFSLLFGILFLFNLKYIVFLLKKFKINTKLMSYAEVISEYTPKELLKVLFLSALRYFIFSVQYILLLFLFKTGISVSEALTGIALTYLVSSIIPVLSILEIGIRGSAAVIFLGIFSVNIPGIISATVLLWIINLVIPAVIGIFIFIKTKL